MSADSDKPRGPTEGELAAHVFELFKRGKNLRQIVEQLSVHPRIVRDLYKEFRRGLEDEDLKEQIEREKAEQRARRREEHAFDKSLDYARDIAKTLLKG